MNFRKIDLEKWERKEFFQTYYQDIPCTYSTTVDIDVTAFVQKVKSRNLKLYLSLIFCLSKTVNMYDEFKTSFDEDGNVGVYETINPSYTIFHEDSKTFSSIWTEFASEFSKFKGNYEIDIAKYGENKLMLPKGAVKNSFNISAVPGLKFSAFNLNLQKGYDYLLPIFTIGGMKEVGDKRLLPIAIQVHHAVCDGYHLSRFIESFERELEKF